MKTTSVMQRTTVKGLAAFGAAYTIGMLTLGATNADAAARRVGSQFCHSSIAGKNVSKGQWFQNEEPVDVGGVCGVPVDSYLDHTYATFLDIQGWNPPGSSTSFAAACVKDWSGFYTACGQSKYFTSQHFNVGLDRWAWWNGPNMYPYIVFNLAPNARIYGFWFGT
jgi:hypothetical protein